MKTLTKVALVGIAMFCTMQAKAQTQSDGLKIAYVDLQKIQDNYGLQVELEDELEKKYAKTQSELATKQKSIENTAATLRKQIEAKGNAIQAKMKKTPATGGYKNEAEYNKDMNAFNQMQTDAQEKLEKLQQEYATLEQTRANEYQTRQQQMIQTVTDSISSYINVYNAEKHYDYILIKSTTLFANPAFDVTDEVLSGLNKKYQEGKNGTSSTSSTPSADASATDNK